MITHRPSHFTSRLFWSGEEQGESESDEYSAGDIWLIFASFLFLLWGLGGLVGLFPPGSDDFRPYYWYYFLLGVGLAGGGGLLLRTLIDEVFLYATAGVMAVIAFLPHTLRTIKGKKEIPLSLREIYGPTDFEFSFFLGLAVGLSVWLVVRHTLKAFRLYFIYFMGARYLRKRFTSYVAIAGVAVGVMVLVVVLSVMGGFQGAFWERMRKSSGDLSLESATSYFGIFDYRTLQEKLEEIPGITSSAPYIKTIVLVESVGVDYGFLKGIDLEQEKNIGRFETFLLSPRATYLKSADFDSLPTKGDIDRAFEELEKALAKEGIEITPEKVPPTYPETWPMDKKLRKLYSTVHDLKWYRQEALKLSDTIEIEKTKTGLPGIILGYEFYESLHLRIGSTLTLTTASGLAMEGVDSVDKKKGIKTREQEFEVVGTIKVGIFSQDRRFVYTNIEAAQDFIGIEGRVSGLTLQCKDYQKAEEIKGDLMYRLQSMADYQNVYVKTWKEKHSGLWKAVQMEKALLSILLFFIILVAGFMIFAILSMMVIEKTKDIGIIKSLGSPAGGILSIFLFQGALIGFVGILLGLALGLGITYNINEIADLIHALTGLHPFPPNIYYLDRIPVQVNFRDIGRICILTFLVSFLFALYPALRASRLNAIEALRYE